MPLLYTEQLAELKFFIYRTEQLRDPPPPPPIFMWLIPTHKLGLPCHTTATNQRRHVTATKYQVTFCECRPHPQLEDMKTKCGTVRRSGENWSSGQLLDNQDAHYQFLGSCSRLGRRQGGGRILYQVNYEENRASGTVCQTSVIPELHLFVENHLINNGPIQSNPTQLSS